MKLKNVINKHKSNKIKENSNTVRHLNNGTDHRHSKSCCDQSSPARRTMSCVSQYIPKKMCTACALLWVWRNNEQIWLNVSHESAPTDDNHNKILKQILTHWGQDKMAATLADDIFKCIFVNENIWILIRTLKFVPEVPIYNKPALVQIMAWYLIGDKPLSEPKIAYFTDAYMCHSVSMSLEKHFHISWDVL